MNDRTQNAALTVRYAARVASLLKCSERNLKSPSSKLPIGTDIYMTVYWPTGWAKNNRLMNLPLHLFYPQDWNKKKLIHSISLLQHKSWILEKFLPGIKSTANKEMLNPILPSCLVRYLCNPQIWLKATTEQEPYESDLHYISWRSDSR
jgi:hypothetical protein